MPTQSSSLRYLHTVPSFILTALLSLLVSNVRAQTVVGPKAGAANAFKDTSPLMVSGDTVAIYEFEDMGCPACADAFPIIHAAVERYKIQLIRHDFPLKLHVWARPAAIAARYLQDKVSPNAADQFRRDVFANQTSIMTKEDLVAFTRKWSADHKQFGGIPENIDPTDQFAAEVEADYTLGNRIGIYETPTIFVVSPAGWILIADYDHLSTAIDTTLAKVTSKVIASHNNRPSAKDSLTN
jgi:protein-disulfide isomerase